MWGTWGAHTERSSFGSEPGLDSWDHEREAELAQEGTNKMRG